MAINPRVNKNLVAVLLASVFASATLIARPSGSSIPADQREIHVLSRLGFGPRPGDIERVKSIGVDRYIDEQLHPASIPLPESLKSKLSGLETVGQARLNCSPSTVRHHMRQIGAINRLRRKRDKEHE